jgi:apolipoprotein N-acyltransferase
MTFAVKSPNKKKMLLPGGETFPGNNTLEEILEFLELIQISETPTEEVCGICARGEV